MRGLVDQSKALRKASRAAWTSAAVSSMLFFLVAARLATDMDPVLAFGVAGLAAVTMFAMTGRQVARLPERYAWREEYVRVPDADLAIERVKRHMARWWAISVSDARGWRSLYDEADGAPAPLRLPFEIDQRGGDLVLRGSALHVAVARRHLQRDEALKAGPRLKGP